MFIPTDSIFLSKLASPAERWDNHNSSNNHRLALSDKEMPLSDNPRPLAQRQGHHRGQHSDKQVHLVLLLANSKALLEGRLHLVVLQINSQLSDHHLHWAARIKAQIKARIKRLASRPSERRQPPRLSARRQMQGRHQALRQRSAKLHSPAHLDNLLLEHSVPNRHLVNPQAAQLLVNPRSQLEQGLSGNQQERRGSASQLLGKQLNRLQTALSPSSVNSSSNQGDSGSLPINNQEQEHLDSSSLQLALSDKQPQSHLHSGHRLSPRQAPLEHQHNQQHLHLASLRQAAFQHLSRMASISHSNHNSLLTRGFPVWLLEPTYQHIQPAVPTINSQASRANLSSISTGRRAIVALTTVNGSASGCLTALHRRTYMPTRSHRYMAKC